VVGDAALVVSELLSNAIRHAAPLPGSTVRVAWTLHEDSLHVAVSDAGGGPMFSGWCGVRGSSGVTFLIERLGRRVSEGL